MTEFPQAGLDAGREALRRFLAGDDDLNAMHTKIALIATETVPACDVASITMLRAGKPTTAAFTGKTALRLDETQYELGDGPCLSAIRHRGLEQMSTTSDDRWPAFVAAASKHGVRATMSVPLGNDEVVIGALNLYSETHAEFDSAARDVACAFADQLGVAVASITLYSEHYELAQQLQQAMESGPRRWEGAGGPSWAGTTSSASPHLWSTGGGGTLARLARLLPRLPEPKHTELAGR